MQAPAAIHYTSHLTFGRETAQFKQLLTVMAIVSIITWAIVLITIALRFFMCHVWYKADPDTTQLAGPPV